MYNPLKNLLKVGLVLSLAILARLALPNIEPGFGASQVTEPAVLEVGTQPQSATRPALTELAPAPSAELIRMLQTQMAAEIGLPVAEIEWLTVQVEATDWSNSCLELAQVTELCAQVVTPGYRVVLQGSTQSRTYHTNQTGSQVRSVPANHPAKSGPPRQVVGL